MDIELTNPEYFPPESVNVLEVMENEKKAYDFYDLYEKFVEERRVVWAGRLGRYLDREFNLGLANK